MAALISPPDLEVIPTRSTPLIPSKSTALECFKIRTRNQHTNDTTRRGPLVARLPLQQVTVLQEQSAAMLADTNQQEVMNLTSQSRGTSSPSATSDGTRPPRKRSPSLTRSRGSSPNSRGRGSSPGGLEPSVLEAVKRRVRRVQQARLYLLQQPGPNSFLVGGDSPEHKYKVVIGPQTCSCGRDPHCLHLLFVMLRVFQVPETDSRIYSKTLKNYEVESLFHKYQERRNSQVNKVHQRNCMESSSLLNMCIQDVDTEDVSLPADSKRDEDLCPICLLAMMDGESLVSCSSGCRNKLHHHCMSVWAAECCQQGEAVICPLCRKVWTPDPGKDPPSTSVQYKQQSLHPSVPTKMLNTKKSWITRGGSVSVPGSPTRPPSSYLTSHTEIIPQDQLANASDWIKVFGADLVSCLYSRDWRARESALKGLAMEVEAVYQSNNEEQQHKVSTCCARLLAFFSTDSVFKVYLSWVRCLRVLLSLSKVVYICELMRPIIRTLLLKCADRNRRISQLSVDVLVDLAKGFKPDCIHPQSNDQTKSERHFDLVLSCVLEDFTTESVPWQWLAGRLIILDLLVKDFAEEFWLHYVPLCPNDTNYKLKNYSRLMSVVEFSFKALGSTHSTVNKLARHVFTVASSMTVKEKDVMSRVLELLVTLEPDLQQRLRKRLHDVLNISDHKKYSAKGSKQVATLNEPGITDCCYQKIDNSTAIAANNKKSPQRPKDLPLTDPSKLRTKRPIMKFSHNDSGIVSTPQKRWGHSGLKLYNLLTRGKRDNVLPNKLDVLCSVSSGSSKTTDTQCSHSPCTPASNRENDLSNRMNEDDYVISLPTSSPQVDSQDTLPFIPGLSCVHLQKGEGGKQTYIEEVDWQRGPLLGTGGSSACFQARDIATGTLMVVKKVSFYRNSQKEQAAMEASIEEEMAVMSSLRHPNVVRLLGATKEGEFFNMFVEWMAGGSVAMLLDKYGPFTDHVISHYTTQVISGLIYLHDNNILHRDLKGANLLVDSSGQRLRIGDFGAAARLGSQNTVPGEVQGQLLGTIAFMAPEVLRGEDFGKSCDIWSLGCCIIEMATTEPPWRETNVSNHLALMYKIACSKEPPKVPESLSCVLRDLTLNCLNMDPELRPSAHELLQHCPGPGSTDVKRVRGS